MSIDKNVVVELLEKEMAKYLDWANKRTDSGERLIFLSAHTAISDILDKIKILNENCDPKGN